MKEKHLKKQNENTAMQCDKKINDDKNESNENKKSSYIKLVFNLFFTMLKIGLFTFGGGYAMIALLEREFVSKKNWIESEEFLNLISIAESTPGPIAINAATYIGYKKAKLSGAFMSTLGVVLPSFIIIFCISLFFNKFLELKLVAYAFKGIQAAVIFLILSAGIKMFKQLDKKVLSIILLLATIIALITLSLLAINFSTIFYILIGGTVALVVYLIVYFKNRNKEDISAEDINGKVIEISLDNKKEEDK